MLIQLRGRHLRALGPTSDRPFIGRLCEDAARSPGPHDVLRLRAPLERLPPGFRAYLLPEGEHRSGDDLRDVYALAKDMAYLAESDVVRIDPRRSWIGALYRRASATNSVLVTERCDNYCLMCSQPPRTEDDSWLVDELMEAIPLFSPETAEIGITGGEPGLLGPRLVQLIEQFAVHLPRTALHVLTNGRAFEDAAFASAVARVGHPDLMLGIPVYSDLPEEHDFVVQARGAFSETLRGILNLKRSGVRVEIRVVIHAETYARLPELARFITRNLLFVDHVALMGLELTGFAKTNLERLWLDPLDYRTQLVDATTQLHQAGMHVSIYNHQLCVLDRRLHRFSRKSISDWKNFYVDDCGTCVSRDECGGFFASSNLRRSRGIAPMGETGCVDSSSR